MKVVINKILTFFAKFPTNFLVIFAYFLISVLALRELIFANETIGFRHDWAIAQTADEIKLWFSHSFHAWIDARGGFSISYLSDYLLRIVLGSLSFLGFGGIFISKLILIVFFVLAGWSSFKLFNKILKNNFASFVASLIFVFNPLTFNKIISGHINYLLAYALTPLFLFSFLSFLQTPFIQKKPSFFWLLFSGLLLGFLGIQIQFPILTIILLITLHIIFPISWKKTLWGIIFCCFIAFLVHLPWLIVLLIEMIFFRNNYISSTPTLFSWFVHNSSYLYQALMSTGGGTDYFSQTLDNYCLYAPFLGLFGLILIFIIVFILILKPNKQHNYLFLFFLGFALVLSLAKIFPFFTFWLINQSFILSVFREIYHLAFLITFCFALLIGITYQKINRYSHYQSKILPIFLVSLILYFLPFFIDGRLLNNLQTFSQKEDYLSFLNNNDRQLFLPSLQPLQITDKEYGGFDLSVYYSPNSSISELGYFSSLPDRFATFFQSQLYFNSKKISPVFEKYLDLFNVQQVIFRNNLQSIHDKFTRLAEYPTIKKYFNQASLEEVVKPYQDKIIQQTDNWELYNFSSSDKISLSASCLSTGDWSDFNQIFLLSKPAACDGIFSFKQFASLPDLTTIDKIFFTNNNSFDLLLGQSQIYPFEPGKLANQTNDSKVDWVSSEHVWWYDPSFAAYSKLLAFTSAQDASLSIPLNSLSKGQYKIYADVYNHPDGGELNFSYQNWQKTINSQNLTKNFVWTELGEINIIDSQPVLKIKNVSGTNALGLLILIPSTNSVDSTIDSILTPEKSIALLSDFQKTGQPAYEEFDLSSNYQSYQNLPSVSDYDIKVDNNKIDIAATFRGDATQNEFASLIYSLDCDPNITSDLVFSAQVSDEQIGFWELGLEVDENQDGVADSITWGQLKNGYNNINIVDFIFPDQPNPDLSKIKITGFRLQPHKEYSIDMNQQVEKEVFFQFSNLKFYTAPDLLTRLPRQSSQLDLEKLVSNPSVKVGLKDKYSFYNPFPDQTQQNVVSEDNKLTINSVFSSQADNAEFSTVIIDTNIDLLTYSYATIDLKVDHPDLQFFDLAWDIDSNYDNLVDQKIWVKSIDFSSDQASKTKFYDILGLLQQKTVDYQQPRVLAIEILPHKQYNLKKDNLPPVSFSIQNINFYHEAALQGSQTKPLATLHNSIDVPRAGKYNLYLNLSSRQNGQLDGSLADQSFSINIDSNKTNTWYKIGEFSLEKKSYDLTLITYNQSFTLNNLALFNENFSQSIEQNNNQISNIQKKSATFYQADIHLDQPSYIVFKESFHPAWLLNTYDQNHHLVATIKPSIINGWQQAYYLNDLGDYQLEFVYSLDSLYRRLLLISLIVISVLVITLLFLRHKSKS